MILPFDLRANGGANNVWIAECGNEAQWGSFDAFRAAVTSASVQVTALGDPTIPGTAFDVVYDSPSQGAIHFNWEDQPTLEGEPIPTAASCVSTTPGHRPTTTVDRRTSAEGYGVRLDVEAGTREVWERDSLNSLKFKIGKFETNSKDGIRNSKRPKYAHLALPVRTNFPSFEALVSNFPFLRILEQPH
jgi:hypothetical protein